MSTRPIYTVIDQNQAFAIRILVRKHRQREVMGLVELAVKDPTKAALVAAAIVDVEDRFNSLDQAVVLGQAGDDPDWLFREMFGTATATAPNTPKQENVELFITEAAREQLMMMLADIPEVPPGSGKVMSNADAFVRKEADSIMVALVDATVYGIERVPDNTEEYPEATQRKPSYKQ